MFKARTLTTTPHITFLTWNVNLPWPSLIKCLMSSPGLIAWPLEYALWTLFLKIFLWVCQATGSDNRTTFCKRSFSFRVNFRSDNSKKPFLHQTAWKLLLLCLHLFQSCLLLPSQIGVNYWRGRPKYIWIFQKYFLGFPT